MKLKLLMICLLIFIADLMTFIVSADSFVKTARHYFFYIDFAFFRTLTILLFCYLLFLNYKFSISLIIFLFFFNKFVDTTYYYCWIDFNLKREKIKNALLMIKEEKNKQESQLFGKILEEKGLFCESYESEAWGTEIQKITHPGWSFISINRFNADAQTGCLRAYYIYCEDSKKELIEEFLRKEITNIDNDFHSFTPLDTNFYLFRKTTGFEPQYVRDKR